MVSCQALGSTNQADKKSNMANIIKLVTIIMLS